MSGKAVAPVGVRARGALFYAASSIAIMFSNKAVLTSWQFPSSSVLALSQFACTVLSLYALRASGRIDFPRLSRSTTRKIMPLPVVFLLNAVFGLAAFKAISIPMFTVVRFMCAGTRALSPPQHATRSPHAHTHTALTHKSASDSPHDARRSSDARPCYLR